jgi:hypothetical protein
MVCGSGPRDGVFEGTTGGNVFFIEAEEGMAMGNESEGEKPKGAIPRDEGAQPTRWWHWVLLYPGLAIAVLGGVPTYVEAVRSHIVGVPFGRSVDAKEQNRLWEENIDCTRNAEFTMITNKKKVEIGSVVCESGDVLLRGKRPEWNQPHHRWVSWDEVAPSQGADSKGSALLEIFRSAHAKEPNQIMLAQVSSVVCQRWVSQGQLLQRIRTREGACFDEVINTFNGQTLSSRQVPCNPAC